jgi:CRISPR-associated protein Csd2
MSTPINNRYDFVYIFDVCNGNPNGDPDAGNLPRIDPETNHGIVTDVCLKRKVRNFVLMTKNDAIPYRIYVKEKAILNKTHEEAHKATGAKETPDKKGRKGSEEEVENARQWMCANFYDVRTFGAVMSLGINCGQVRGPVQLAFGRSVDPVTPLEASITRCAVATEEEAAKQSGDNRTMGRKNYVPYGLYVAHGFISAHLAAQTGFSQDDLELLWNALGSMFEHDRSAARGEMTTRKLVIFQHASALGNAPAHLLFERVQIARKPEVAVPRAFADYTVSVDQTNLPDGIQVLLNP